MLDDLDQRRARTEAARHASLERNAERAARDPQKLARAVRIVRAADRLGILEPEAVQP